MPRRVIALVIVFIAQSLLAQVTIQGTVRDAETRQPLAYTNIQIKNSYQGTITNRDGRFTLPIKRLPAILVVRYIGYETQEVTVSRATQHLDIRLALAPVRAPKIVVTAEDPAVGILAQVIRHKQVWRAGLKTFEAEAYTRAKLENDTAIVSISESTSRLFWDHEKGSRELVRSRRESSNITSNDNFAFAGVIPNLYDDDIEIMGFRMVGPTHPDALKHYHVKMIGERPLGDKTVIDIEIWPKNKLQPTFVGRISVLYEDEALIDVDVKPNRAMLFPMPIRDLNMHFRQQFSNFGGDFWLPVDARIEGDIAIGMTGLSFPTIRYNQVSRLSDYVLNGPLPDSLFQDRGTIHVDSTTIESDTLLAATADRIPMTERETEAYTTLDSTMTLAKAFKPTGPLARFVNVETDNDGEGGGEARASMGFASGLGPALRYNRVDGLRLGAGWERRFFGRWTLRGHGAYSFGLKRWSGGAGTELRVNRWLTAKAEWRDESRPWIDSWNLPVAINSAVNGFGGRDRFDWLWQRGWDAELEFRIRKLSSRISLMAADHEHSALDKTSDWGLFNRDREQRENPAPETSTLRTVGAKLIIGDDFVPWGTVGNNRLELRIEHSDPDLWNSDGDYTRYEACWEGRLPTWLRRRFLPMALDFRVTAGTHSGTLPAERLFALDGRIGAFTPFGVFKTLSGHRVMGDEYVGVFWEHHFRTVPFELLGLRGLAQKGMGVLLTGASGRTWLDADRLPTLPQRFTYWDGWQHEIGLSVTGILDLFRVDLSHRLGGKGLYAGVSVARLF